MKKYYKEILKLQKQINKSLSTTKFFHIYKDFFYKIYKEKNFSIQHYFYLRAVKPKKNKNFKPSHCIEKVFKALFILKKCITFGYHFLIAIMKMHLNFIQKVINL